MKIRLAPVRLALALTAFLAAAAAAAPAQAGIMSLIEIVPRAGGFLAPVFHSASANHGMSGQILADITGFTDGFFNTDTGEISIDFTVAPKNTAAGSGAVRAEARGGFGDLAGLKDTANSGGVLGAITFRFFNAGDAEVFLSGAVAQTVRFLDATYTNASPKPNILIENADLTKDLVLWGSSGAIDTANAAKGYFIAAPDTLGADLHLRFQHDVPQPATYLLFAMGLAGLGLMRRRQKVLAENS